MNTIASKSFHVIILTITCETPLAGSYNSNIIIWYYNNGLDTNTMQWVIDEVVGSIECKNTIVQCVNCTTNVCWVIDEVVGSIEVKYCINCANYTTHIIEF